ncbi:heme ABC transporter ATP-binding protein [Tomitella biformata]|uniref:heme ABC transporter ATP-binding protein n=1 Tax=Tomitella biformata TaxID=630403 RepID=UPI00046584E6|nr:heme ABC transporter ATP-binding protein [Tomitella biformata]
MIRKFRFSATHTEPAAPSAGDVTLRARELTVLRDKRPILDGVELEVVAGEVLALVGPNGAGKSTLLAALAGDLPAHTGRVELDGLPLADWSTSEMSRRRAVLPQQHRLGFGFTVHEVVQMGRAPWARTDRGRDDERAVAEAMKICDIEGFTQRSFATLSGGEQARVALARVLAQDTPTIMLDEPTAALDLHHQETVMQIAAERAASGVGVVVVLHDLGLAAAYADKIAVLSGGRIATYGRPDEVLTAELLTDVYRHPVEVLQHPETGRQLILPLRPGSIF